MSAMKIMVVDDEPGMRLGATRALRDFTFRVPEVEEDVCFEMSQAETAEEALEKIRRDPPQILLLDHKLPGMSGIDLLERLPERAGDLLVVMITAYASIEIAVLATKRGAYDFLAKPFTPDELKSVVRKAATRLALTREARRLAEEKRRVRFEFVRVLGHELKAPLNAVEGYLRIFAERTLGDFPAAYDEMIRRSLDRIDSMRKLVSDLLDMTRLESGQKERHLAALDLAEVARKAIETLAPDAEKRKIAIELRAPQPVAMAADRGELEMILNNLVSNAVKYNRDGGRVELRLERQGDKVEISVSDTGIGMTAEEVGKLFGEFVRIRNDKTKNILGSGLGLSILKKIAKLYDGDIRIESEPDRGSVFTVTLCDRAPVATA